MSNEIKTIDGEYTLAEIAARSYEFVDENDRGIVYLDAPNESANRVTVAEGRVCDTDVYERVFLNNSKVPSYIFRYHAGQAPLRSHVNYAENYRLGDYPVNI